MDDVEAEAMSITSLVTRGWFCDPLSIAQVVNVQDTLVGEIETGPELIGFLCHDDTLSGTIESDTFVGEIVDAPTLVGSITSTNLVGFLECRDD